MKPVIHIYQGIDGAYYLRVVASNGQIILDSEGYTRRWSAKRAARRISDVFGLPIIEAAG